ncbi:phenylacetate-CoA oxygenase subunit PaaJ [Nisaea acidiphila]|uniref:Phenylacetate-CoA oxygenase subunit PaaJ n=1 Tax=Nisaea acidiphila TaxID=1862145 RepID=A0A9J7AY00_9PROT|nr:1,2-phenylacetyl-CoA epoxidase subunit PaaD [Nisaea acidiphila]UUX50301.1 phenylacetate-CoA oxygenase subunit PaaJ [Nisaea acidiphila]
MQPQSASTPDESRLWAALEGVSDPEIPVLSVVDLGVVRAVAVDGHAAKITITPTYSGCPAMSYIEMMVRDAALKEGFAEVEVKTVLAPAWTTDWLSEAGREKLRGIGIAPPAESSTSKQSLLGIDPVVACPRCGSENTEILSQFGSTACKALYRCTDCAEPFDYFKCI